MTWIMTVIGGPFWSTLTSPRLLGCGRLTTVLDYGVKTVVTLYISGFLKILLRAVITGLQKQWKS